MVIFVLVFEDNSTARGDVDCDSIVSKFASTLDGKTVAVLRRLPISYNQTHEARRIVPFYGEKLCPSHACIPWQGCG